MPESSTAGDVVAAFLERCNVDTVFGVISIHNMPILDAISRRNRIRFVMSRGEAGAANMADAHARVSGGLGVFVTSTGSGAGNACGALVEAQTAGTPLLHLTGQIERDYLDRGRGYIHEARDQLAMLKSVSKAAYRVWSEDTLLGTLREAVRTALTPPAGPVSVEIPIDVQEAAMVLPLNMDPLHADAPAPSEEAVDALADALAPARRPMLWLGGGARHAGTAVARLVELGFGVVTSVQGRGVIAEDHPMTLGAFNLQPDIESFYKSCDAMLVVGSRLRGNETLKYTLALPKPLYQIDADPAADGRSYPVDRFVTGDSAWTLSMLADRLEGRIDVERRFAKDLAAARKAAESGDCASRSAPTTRCSMWCRPRRRATSSGCATSPCPTAPGETACPRFRDRATACTRSAAVSARGCRWRSARPSRPTDARPWRCRATAGSRCVIGEMATASQERADLTLLVMNDGGYGVIRNIQDAKFERPARLHGTADTGLRQGCRRRRDTVLADRRRGGPADGAEGCAGRRRPGHRRGRHDRDRRVSPGRSPARRSGRQRNDAHRRAC